MTSAAAFKSALTARERLIVALDVETAGEAESIVRELSGSVGAFKIGLQLFTAEGPTFVRRVIDSGAKIFLDLKFHDIPNTVAKASVEAARRGVWMCNLHASGGGEMMRRTIDEVATDCDKRGVIVPKIIAVTVLTSSNNKTLYEIGVGSSTDDQVVRLAELTAVSGLGGVVASALEASAIRQNSNIDSDFLIVTPGIRPLTATNDDQKRVMTPSEAIANGSDYLVIGRPVTAASDRLSAVQDIVTEIESNETTPE